MKLPTEWVCMSDRAGITHRPPASMTGPVKSDGLVAGKPASLPSRTSTFRVLSERVPTSKTRAPVMYRFCAVAVWPAPNTAISITTPQAAVVSSLWANKLRLLLQGTLVLHTCCTRPGAPPGQDASESETHTANQAEQEHQDG